MRARRRAIRESRGGIALGFLLIAAALITSCGRQVTYTSGPVLGPQTFDYQPAWDPADSVIAYTHVAQTITELQLGQYQIWLLNLRDGSVRFFASGQNPSWSPDGLEIAYEGNTGDICVQPLAAASPSMATDIGPCAHPSWSPTQPLIAFDTRHNDPTGSRVIWTIHVDGTGLTDVSTHGTGEWLEPSWSPDGAEIIHYR